MRQQISHTRVVLQSEEQTLPLETQEKREDVSALTGATKWRRAAYCLAVLLALSGLALGWLAGRTVRAGSLTRAPATTRGSMQAATVQASASPTHPVVRLLVRDTFGRPDQPFWGAASSEWSWGADANTQAAFAIVRGRGRIVGGEGFFTAVIGPTVANLEVEAQAAISQFDQTNFGVVARWKDGENYYKLLLDGTHLVLMKRVAGRATTLVSRPFSAQIGVFYSLRLLVVGHFLRASAWRTGEQEPRDWLISASDTSLSSGLGGLRVLLHPHVAVEASLFEEAGGSESTVKVSS